MIGHDLQVDRVDGFLLVSREESRSDEKSYDYEGYDQNEDGLDYVSVAIGAHLTGELLGLREVFLAVATDSAFVPETAIAKRVLCISPQTSIIIWTFYKVIACIA